MRGHRHLLPEELAGLGLPGGDHVLFGSGPLLVRGWIENVGDLDLLARSPCT